MGNNLKKEFEFYKKNQKMLVEKYDGLFLVIKDETVIGDFNTEIEAYSFGEKEYGLGSFLIQKVENGQENYSQTFYSRVMV